MRKVLIVFCFLFSTLANAEQDNPFTDQELSLVDSVLQGSLAYLPNDIRKLMWHIYEQYMPQNELTEFWRDIQSGARVVSSQELALELDAMISFLETRLSTEEQKIALILIEYKKMLASGEAVIVQDSQALRRNCKTLNKLVVKCQLIAGNLTVCGDIRLCGQIIGPSGTINGTPGPEGPTGPQGPIGPTGPAGGGTGAGATGATGPTGPAGAMGAMGEIGPMGATGATGDQGEVGATGSTGPQGEVGSAGATGDIGPIGPTGNTGAQGESVTGATGAQGEAGSTGATGEVGPMGATGATGAQGEVGATGPTGAQGEVGSTGATGEVGPMGSTGATGAQGEVGATGPTGAQGAMGSTGATGEVGPMGATGATGEMGPTGATGPTGPVAIGTYIFACQTSAQSLNNGDNLLEFNEVPINNGWTPGPDPVTRVQPTVSGLYKITYSVNVEFSGAAASVTIQAFLRQNFNPVSGSSSTVVVPNALSVSVNIFREIEIFLSSGDVIELQLEVSPVIGASCRNAGLAIQQIA